MAKRARYLDQDAEIDLRKLRYFLAVAERLNFGRAAQELILAQPALSRAIKALEEDLGVVLFDRDYHTVALTDAGKVLVAEAGTLLARAGAARRRVRAAAVPAPRLTVGHDAGIDLDPTVRRFRRTQPEVELSLRELDRESANCLLLDGQVDIALVRASLDESVVDGIDLVGLAEDGLALRSATANRSRPEVATFLALAAEDLGDLARAARRPEAELATVAVWPNR